MPQMEPAISLDHVLVSRLSAVGKSEGDEFTDDELNHLKECCSCFQLWKLFILDSDGDEENRR
jgi:hypothetical protein